ncbi:MAG: hypothetical protein IJZ90_04055, partial [Clostridia bacterium]|nr:hypothetical protein [Clostridia bacterium]
DEVLKADGCIRILHLISLAVLDRFKVNCPSGKRGHPGVLLKEKPCKKPSFPSTENSAFCFQYSYPAKPKEQVILSDYRVFW